MIQYVRSARIGGTGAPGGGREVDDDLADVLRLGQVPEGAEGLAGREDAHRERAERAVGQGRRELGRETGAERGVLAEHVGEVEGVVLDVGTDLGDAGGVPDPDLADLDEAATGGERLEAPGDEVPGEAVEDDVDAAAAGPVPDLGGEVEGPGVHDVADASLPEEPLLAGARGREDLGAGPAEDLEGGLADPAGRGVDEDAVAGADAGAVQERVERREVHGR